MKRVTSKMSEENGITYEQKRELLWLIKKHRIRFLTI